MQCQPTKNLERMRIRGYELRKRYKSSFSTSIYISHSTSPYSLPLSPNSILLFTLVCLRCMWTLIIEGAVVGSQGTNDGLKLCACNLVDH